MDMDMLASHFDGIKIIKPKFDNSEFSNYSDVYSESIFSQELEIDDKFIIDHQITSKYGTIRGLYYQLDEYAQSYLVRSLKGIVLCVFVDLRIDSETYGECFSMRISDADQLQIYVCRGFAMGFITLSDESTMLIKTNKEWDADNCRFIKYNDDDLEIDWILDSEEINCLNENGRSFNDVEKF